ncbi:hypothetical protein OROMI_005566 [Orobanche minor]
MQQMQAGHRAVLWRLLIHEVFGIDTRILTNYSKHDVVVILFAYGENIKEVNENSDWVCPVCREICNCSRCRRDKGWMPTGAIYNRVAKLGFKSVAHYLIHTRRGQATEWTGPAGPISGDGSVPIDDGKEELITDALSIPSFGVEKIEGEKDDVKPDSDEEYIGDDYEDADEDDDDNNDKDSSENYG